MGKQRIAEVSTAVGASGPTEASGPVLALTVVSHPQARRAGERCLLDGLAGGRGVALSRNAPDFARPGAVLGSPLDDPFLSRQPIRILPGERGGVRLSAGESGTRLVAGLASGGELELSAEELAAGVPLELADRVVLLLHTCEREAAGSGGGSGGSGDAGVLGDALGMVGHSAALARVRTAVERIADLAVPVLIRGETGTGKELVARAIHERGPRRAAPFVSVNLGAIPRELVAAELFGATRGAYTGATRDREGLFRTADGGTLFLDELGEAPPEVQVMLLRVLETGEVTPLGADRPVATGVRLIAATDAPLEEQIRDGRFKAPLLHRLAGYELRVPPLRERREDIGVLLHAFARQELAAVGELHRLAPPDPYAAPWLPAALAGQLVRSAWPGNIRQLKNLTRQLVIESRGLPQLRLDPRLAEQLAPAAPAATSASVEPVASTAPSLSSVPPVLPAPPAVPAGAARRKAAEIPEPELREALRANAWDLKAAADQLGIARPSIYDLIERSTSLRTAGELSSEEIAQCFRDCAGDLDAMAARLEVSRRALGRRVKELKLAAATPRDDDR